MTRHNAVSHTFENLASGMALFAELSQFQHHAIAEKSITYTQFRKVDAGNDQVFAKVAEVNGSAFGVEIIDMLKR